MWKSFAPLQGVDDDGNDDFDWFLEEPLTQQEPVPTSSTNVPPPDPAGTMVQQHLVDHSSDAVRGEAVFSPTEPSPRGPLPSPTLTAIKPQNSDKSRTLAADCSAGAAAASEIPDWVQKSLAAQKLPSKATSVVSSSHLGKTLGGVHQLGEGMETDDDPDDCDWFFGGKVGPDGVPLPPPSRAGAFGDDDEGSLSREALLLFSQALAGSGMVDGEDLATPRYRPSTPANVHQPQRRQLEALCPAPPPRTLAAQLWSQLESAPGVVREIHATAVSGEATAERRRLCALAVSLQHGHREEMRLAATAMLLAASAGRSGWESAPSDREAPSALRVEGRGGDGGLLSSVYNVDWGRCVSVRQLPGTSIEKSVVVRGVCLLTDEHGLQMDRLLAASGIGCRGPPEGGADGIKQSLEGCEYALAVFVDGPLVQSRQAHTGQGFSAAKTTSEGRHITPSGRSYQSLHDEATAMLMAPDIVEEEAGAAAVQWLRNLASSAADDLRPPSWMARSEDGAVPLARYAGDRLPILLLCSGHVPPRGVALMMESEGIVVLPSLGAAAVRAGASACGVKLLGPEPWRAGASAFEQPSHAPSGHRDGAKSAGWVRWHTQAGGRRVDEATTYSTFGGSDRWISPGAASQASVLSIEPLVSASKQAPPSSVADSSSSSGEKGRCCSVLLHTPLPATCDAAEAAMVRCARRLSSAAGDRRVVPGGGVLELQCAMWLWRLSGSGCRKAAGDVACPLPDGAQKGGGCGVGGPPAWQLVNSQLAGDGPAYRAAVLQAVADAMEDLAVVLLQNLGLSYQQAAEGVSGCKHQLRAGGWCSGRAGDVSTRMTATQVLQAQQAAQLQGVGDTQFAADDASARRAGLSACAHVVGVLLRSDERIVNHRAV